MEASEAAKKWEIESYFHQTRNIWPGRGRHILAQFDEDTVVVYQAYKKEISEYAVKHQRFSGCPAFGEDRMTWIKTNFLWMMFRSGWSAKHNQEHVLAIWLKRDAFEKYLENAREKGSSRGFGTVRLQWDPDHNPHGDPIARRAVQLGLKHVKTFANGDDIVYIQDVSEFCREQSRLITKKSISEELMVAKERVFVPKSVEARNALALDKPPKEDE